MLNNSELGKKSQYHATYDPTKLFRVPRKSKRDEIGVDTNNLPFYGFDCWNHYEVSWLNEKGKPVVATAQIFYDCKSEYIIESKSFKLYFNSLNNSKFTSFQEVQNIITKDVSNELESHVEVILRPLNSNDLIDVKNTFAGESIDDLDIECDEYLVNPELLKCNSNEIITETLNSDLLKSNCLVTHQPDWGSVQIHYKGPKIDRESLLKYIVSFRNHNEFHEQCIERIFIDIKNKCNPEKLTVYGRYTRRGGLDINPYRATEEHINFLEKNIRLKRQ